jgi:hypothetical protein
MELGPQGFSGFQGSLLGDSDREEPLHAANEKHAVRNGGRGQDHLTHEIGGQQLKRGAGPGKRSAWALVGHFD